MITRRQRLGRMMGAVLLISATGLAGAADTGEREARKWRETHQGQPPGQRLSPDERQQLRELRHERQRERFEQADKDGDRALSKDEAAKGAPRLNEKFDDVDANRDGRATPDEIRAFRRERAKLRRIERGGADPRF